MTQKKVFMVIFLSTISLLHLFSDVPPARLHQPDVPYFLESMSFRTVKMQIFPERYAGMFVDTYGDLFLNPAFILRQSKKSVYLDFNVQNQVPYFSPPLFSRSHSYYNYYTDYLVQPTWYPITSRESVQTSPLYQLAAIIPLGSKITVGLINRSIYDYEPFRRFSSYYWRFEYFQGAGGGSELMPDRMDLDTNQQKVFGTQTEMLLGIQLSNRIDLGFRLGYFTYNRDGTLYDKKFGVYPHSSLDNLNDEFFKINGHHVETGVGLLFHLSEKTRLGFYGGYIKGKSSEEIDSIDNMDTWSERDTDTKYYSKYQKFLKSGESYSSDGERPGINISFEHDLSAKLSLRSAFSLKWSQIGLSGLTESDVTYFNDYTYDVWDHSYSYLRRREYRSERKSGLHGTDDISTRHWKWFASLVYSQKEDWSFFGGIQILNDSFKEEIDETSEYKSNFRTIYSIYKPESSRDFYHQEKIYSLTANYKKWSVSIPVGINARVYKGLYLILGTDLTLSSTDQDSEGKVLYPRKINRKWEDGVLIVEDVEIDRYEEYKSDPAKKLDKTVGHYFGLVYKFSFGGKLYLRSSGDVFHTANWALGFEMNW